MSQLKVQETAANLPAVFAALDTLIVWAFWSIASLAVLLAGKYFYRHHYKVLDDPRDDAYLTRIGWLCNPPAFARASK